MAGPMTSVKEETLPHYAESLQDAGYTVLAFDNRNFGESAGEPRQHLDTHEQVEDLKNAVSYMLAREDTDPERIGLLLRVSGGRATGWRWPPWTCGSRP